MLPELSTRNIILFPTKHLHFGKVPPIEDRARLDMRSLSSVCILEVRTSSASWSAFPHLISLAKEPFAYQTIRFAYGDLSFAYKLAYLDT